jgi:hypothetical protein
MILERGGFALNVAVECSGPAVVLPHRHTLDPRVRDDVAPVPASRLPRGRLRPEGARALELFVVRERQGEHAADLAHVMEGAGAAPAHLVPLERPRQTTEIVLRVLESTPQ